MLSKALFTVNAAVCAGPGIALLIAPGMLMAVYGLALDARGAFMGRLLGSTLIGLAWVFWQVRTTTDRKMHTTVLCVCLLVNVLQAIIIFAGITSGLLNGLGWPALALHLSLATAFVVAAFRRDCD
jgi:TRAP-type C4-dicarboxylate transport system permease large subunit